MTMTAAERIKNSSERFFAHVMKALEPSLHPGSADRIRPAVSRDGKLLPDTLMVKAIFDHLHTEHGSKNLKASVAERVVSPSKGMGDMAAAAARFRLEWKDGKEPLGRVLEVLPIKESSRKQLLNELSYDLADRSPGQQAAAVLGKITNRDFREAHFAPEFQWPVSDNELRLRGILDSRFGDAIPSGTDRDAFARSLAEQGVGHSQTDVMLVNNIARSLQIQGKLPADDPRKTERAPIAAPEVDDSSRPSPVSSRSSLVS